VIVGGEVPCTKKKKERPDCHGKVKRTSFFQGKKKEKTRPRGVPKKGPKSCPRKPGRGGEKGSDPAPRERPGR